MIVDHLSTETLIVKWSKQKVAVSNIFWFSALSSAHYNPVPFLCNPISFGSLLESLEVHLH